jgi:hypothetical protein
VPARYIINNGALIRRQLKKGRALIVGSVVGRREHRFLRTTRRSPQSQAPSSGSPDGASSLTPTLPAP